MDDARLLEQNVGIKKRKKLKDLGYDDDSGDEDHEQWNERMLREDGDNDELMDDFASDNENENENNEPKPRNEDILDELDREDPMENYGQEEADSDDDTEQRDDSYYTNQEEPKQESTKYEPKLDAFNMNEENEENEYLGNGEYVRKEDSDNEDQDLWLKDVDKKSIRKAREAEQERKAKQNQPTTNDKINISENLKLLAYELNIGESPLEALSRLNKNRNKQEIKSSIATITDCASNLMDKYNTIYEQSREEMTREYTRITGTQLTIKRKRTQQSDEWEFKWADYDTEIQGPFSTQEIQDWIRWNYFDNNVLVRNTKDSSFQPIYDIF